MNDGSVRIDITAEDSDIKKKLDGVGDEAEEAAEKLDDLGDSSEKSGKGFDIANVAIGNFISEGVTALIGKVGEAISSLIALADETREYREDMAKLTAAFKTAGHGTEVAQKAYDDFYKILGESDRSVEAANHLAELTKSEKPRPGLCLPTWLLLQDRILITSKSKTAMISTSWHRHV